MKSNITEREVKWKFDGILISSQRNYLTTITNAVAVQCDVISVTYVKMMGDKLSVNCKVS